MLEEILINKFGISKEVISLSNKLESKLDDVFSNLDNISQFNQAKVLYAMQKNKLSDIHFNGTTGYGYNDIGRDVIEKIYADVFEAEDALVRTQFISGTHTISTALFAILRPGDTVLSINGKPYDTLDQVIGIKENTSSLKAFGVKYDAIELKDDSYDMDAIGEYLNNNDVKLVIMQRSKGYMWRKSFTVKEIGDVIKQIKKIRPDVYVMVDNCYGEFTQKEEPVQVGADIAVGSLIKNIGGGLAPMGGYIVGKKELIDLCSERLTAPGLGKEGGATLGANRAILQGLFMAPHTVNQALKVSCFASVMLEELGYNVMPKYNNERADIVQAIKFGTREKLIKYCQGIQQGSPVDTMAVPEPWDMPGYTDQVIMAAGTFIQGSSIEISSDGPIREPYIGYMQGGLTYESGKIAVMKAISKLEE